MPPDAAEQSLINGRYSLIRELGRGSTGRVYAAWDHTLGRQVAVKILEHSLANDVEIVTRFEQEIKYTARLNHPGIVALFESGRMPDQARCYFMSLARGISLEAHIEKMKKSPDHWRHFALIERLTMFLKLLEVISFAHAQDIVHRDVKPANVMIGSYGELWVLDWGLARSLREEEPQMPTQVETIYEDLFEGAHKQEAATVIMNPSGKYAASSAEPSTERECLDE
jgi:eukaryotic-like serine/threonine-protein kinase